MPIPAWRAAQTTSTTGTGTVVLNAAPTGRRSFQASFGAGSIRIGYVIQGTTFWEVGYGDFDGASPGNLTRATVLASSNSNTLVSLPSGTADLFAFLDPASRALVASTATTVALTVADLGNLVVWSGTSVGTVVFPAVATVPPGNGFLVTNRGTVNLTIDPNAAELINGAATLVLKPTETADCYISAGAWVAVVAAPLVTIPAAGSRVVVASTAATVTLALTDLGCLLAWSGTAAGTAVFPAIAGVASGNGYLVTNRGTVTLTIDPNAAELINGAATLVLLPGESADCYNTSGAWSAVVSTPFAGFSRIVRFTASGTWTVPAGITRARVRIWGGGAGGGGGDGGTVTGGAGGGGGGYGEDIITGLVPGAGVTITIGAAGAGGAASANGASGGTSSFGASLSGTGGVGGSGGGGAGGGGGVGSGGGGNAILGFGGRGGAGDPSVGGQGGGGAMGGGGGGGGINNAGNVGSFPSGAGSGGANGVVGSAGAAGLVIIEF